MHAHVVGDRDIAALNVYLHQGLPSLGDDVHPSYPSRERLCIGFARMFYASHPLRQGTALRGLARVPRSYLARRLSKIPACPAIAPIRIAPGATTVPGSTMLSRSWAPSPTRA